MSDGKWFALLALVGVSMGVIGWVSGAVHATPDPWGELDLKAMCTAVKGDGECVTKHQDRLTPERNHD